MDPSEIENLVLTVMPGARVRATDMTGTRDHWEVEVVSADFAGKSLIERHRALHKIFAPYLNGAIHAVKYRTLTPEEAGATGRNS